VISQANKISGATVKNKIPVRNYVVAVFALIGFFGLQYKLSGTAIPGSAVSMYDNALLLIGSIGALVALLWPAKPKT
jgi:protein-S-isoprenylcysteine O-methyltransferase Ste14